MKSIAVLIPCYNEAKTISKVVCDCVAATSDYSSTVYVYDNNSTDNTSEIALEAGAVVRSEPMQGKGNVIRRMFREINADCYILIDGDDTYDTSKIPDMIDMILHENADMVVGDRLSSTYFTENKRPFHNFGNIIVRHAVNTVFKTDIKDIMTGFRAFGRDFVKTFPVISKGFEIETEMTIHAADKKMNVRNLIIEYRDRPSGSISKLNTFSDGFKVIRTIIKLYRSYRPLSFFTWLAIILFAIALAIFIPAVMLPYFATGRVERFPTLIVCGFIGIASLLSYYCGLTLDSIANKERREFEFRRQMIHELYEQKKER